MANTKNTILAVILAILIILVIVGGGYTIKYLLDEQKTLGQPDKVYVLQDDVSTTLNVPETQTQSQEQIEALQKSMADLQKEILALESANQKLSEEKAEETSNTQETVEVETTSNSYQACLNEVDNLETDLDNLKDDYEDFESDDLDAAQEDYKDDVDEITQMVADNETADDIKDFEDDDLEDSEKDLEDAEKDLQDIYDEYVDKLKDLVDKRIDCLNVARSDARSVFSLSSPSTVQCSEAESVAKKAKNLAEDFEDDASDEASDSQDEEDDAKTDYDARIVSRDNADAAGNTYLGDYYQHLADSDEDKENFWNDVYDEYNTAEDDFKDKVDDLENDIDDIEDDC
jgi:hypothetical protein